MTRSGVRFPSAPPSFKPKSSSKVPKTPGKPGVIHFNASCRSGMDFLPKGMFPLRNLVLDHPGLGGACYRRKDRRTICERQGRRRRSIQRIRRQFLTACSSRPTVLPSILPSTDTSRTVWRHSTVRYYVGGFARNVSANSTGQAVLAIRKSAGTGT